MATIKKSPLGDFFIVAEALMLNKKYLVKGIFYFGENINNEEMWHLGNFFL